MRNSIATGRHGIYAIFALVLLLPVLMLTGSCSMSYSFTGASISPEVKTISIENFPNKSMLVVATLSRNFTEALQAYFTSQTNLILVDRNGDLHLEGSITGYAVQPQAISGNEVAQLNRLTITVQVKFTNKFDEKQNFESTFSRYLDYPSSQNLVSVQDDLIQEINEQLVQDIFNKAVVNW
ncbi:MAG: LptE family protein [Bacteroidia bacterium]|nr:LptE family protein [Bacteroidia bacterium]